MNTTEGVRSKLFSSSKVVESNSLLKIDLNEFTFRDKISFENIDFGYNNSLILQNVSLEVNKGDSIGIIGESGTGKSTLVDLISGLISPCSGNIECNGNLISDSLEFWKNNLGYVSQNIFLLEGSIAENIAIGIPNNEINLEKTIYD